jgi:hypothetical protein
MKAIQAAGGGMRVRSLLAGALVAAIAIPAFALYNTQMPEKGQTKKKEAVERSISLKLPLQQADFHWVFKNRYDFLAGKLALRITRAGKSEDIIIFEKGKLSDGWQSLPTTPNMGDGAYFGFVSAKKYPTAPGDALELELTVTKDLNGIGPTETGILSAGTYKAKGSYSGLLDEFNTSLLTADMTKKHGMVTEEDGKLLNKMHEMYDYKAFLETWATQWPLKMTGNKGWLPVEQAAAMKAGTEKMKADEARKKRLEVKSEPVERMIRVRLPLDGVGREWVFDSRADLLAGKLVIRIKRGGKTNEIVVFEKGKYSQGWRQMLIGGVVLEPDTITVTKGGQSIEVPNPKSNAPGTIAYYGYDSTVKYLTAPGDELEIELTAVKGLHGHGPDRADVLPAGTYKSTGTYKRLVDECDPELLKNAPGQPPLKGRELERTRAMNSYVATMENWTEKWPLKSVKAEAK